MADSISFGLTVQGFGSPLFTERVLAAYYFIRMIYMYFELLFGTLD